MRSMFYMLVVCVDTV